MKNSFLFILGCSSLCFLVSCATASKMKANFRVPGEDGIALLPGAKIKIVASEDDPIALAAKQGIEKDFAEIAQKNISEAVSRAEASGQDVAAAEQQATAEQFVISDDDPNYWMFVKSSSEKREDTPEQVKFNTSWRVERNENEAGGHEVLKVADGSPTAAYACSTTISLYSRHGLLPIHDFEARSFQEGKGAAQVVAKVNSALLSTSREKIVKYPSGADSSLAKAIMNGDLKKLNSRIAELKMTTLDGFMAKMDDLEKKADREVFKAMLPEMSNYFLMAVDFERNNLDTRSLRLARKVYSSLLRNTEDAGLAEACVDSLVRVEHTLAMLDSLKK